MRIKKNIVFWVLWLSVFCITIFGNIVTTKVKIVGDSMTPTLNNSEKYLALNLTFKKEINRFDIINFKIENYQKRLVKRVVGLPNEYLVITSNGDIYANGLLIEQNFISKEEKEKTLSPLGCDILNIQLKKDEYFVLGDNRENSVDSRFFGCVKKENIESVILQKFSFKNFSFLN